MKEHYDHVYPGLRYVPKSFQGKVGVEFELQFSDGLSLTPVTPHFSTVRPLPQGMPNTPDCASMQDICELDNLLNDVH